MWDAEGDEAKSSGWDDDRVRDDEVRMVEEDNEDESIWKRFLLLPPPSLNEGCLETDANAGLVNVGLVNVGLVVGAGGEKAGLVKVGWANMGLA